MNKSKKETALERKIIKMLPVKVVPLAEAIFNDPEICALQEYSNIVSIKRLGFNDHGPVHMKIAAINAITMFDLLKKADIMLNLEKEIDASPEDSLSAVLTAALLHDVGMTIGRSNHEIHGAYIAYPIITRILSRFYSDPLLLSAIRATAVEGITGHMATQKTTSLEAGLILIADGCDMEHGRARITSQLSKQAKLGDIHRYSAAAIQKVSIEKGSERPIRITIEMESNAGFFQVEEVLYPKIEMSPVKEYIELFAKKTGSSEQHYL